MEMADVIVINKADGENQNAAREARMEFKRALHLYPPKPNGWQPKVLLSSALNNTGIKEVWDLIEEYLDYVKKNGHFEMNRQEQNKYWLIQTINDHLRLRFYQDPEIKKALEIQLKAIENKETTPFAAAEYLLKLKP